MSPPSPRSTVAHSPLGRDSFCDGPPVRARRPGPGPSLGAGCPPHLSPHAASGLSSFAAARPPGVPDPASPRFGWSAAASAAAAVSVHKQAEILSEVGCGDGSDVENVSLWSRSGRIRVRPLVRSSICGLVRGTEGARKRGTDGGRAR